MLAFDIRTLEARATNVDGVLAPDDPVWEEGDARTIGGIRVTGRLSSAGGSRFYFNGHMEGRAAVDCRRCLTPVEPGVSEDLHLFFVDSDDTETDDDDPDVYRMNPKTGLLDLRPAIREQWLLAAPTLVLCREECKGLCPTCGHDLNTSSCSCTPSTDTRWDALRTLKHDASS